jgi:endogenous inhibitor of DNA gyrase (YacG/DUF329 family)
MKAQPRTGKTVPCEQCGKLVYMYLWRLNKHKRSFCSCACHNEANKKGKIVPCEQCGKLVYRQRRSLKRNKHFFCSFFCMSVVRKTGSISADGYKIITVNGRRVLEHRVVVEKKIGRPLMRKERVHHKNGIRTDNRLCNLELWASDHGSGQRVKDLVKHAKHILATYECIVSMKI